MVTVAYATANGTTIGGTPANPLPITTINFQSNGSGPIAPNAPVSINVPASTNSVGAQTEPINGLLLDLSGATQFGSAYGVTDMSQDGYTAGLLTSISVESDGVIMARYSNGQSKPSGQIEIANFRNPQGLQPVGDNAWARTHASGDPVIGVPGATSVSSVRIPSCSSPRPSSRASAATTPASPCWSGTRLAGATATT